MRDVNGGGDCDGISFRKISDSLGNGDAEDRERGDDTDRCSDGGQPASEGRYERQVLVAFGIRQFGGVSPEAFIGRERSLVFSFKFVRRHEEKRVIAKRLQVMSASQVHPRWVGVR